MTIPYLIIELLVDLAAIVLGISLIVRAEDNRPRLWWGIISVLIGATFVWENVGWLVIVNAEPTYRFASLLDISKMLEFYAVATVIGFFPMASLRPGYLTTSRVLTFLLPAVVVITMGVSYLLFDCAVTPLSTPTELLNNMGARDVMLRLFIFACSVVTPLGCFLYPLAAVRRTQHTRRRPTRLMWLLLVAILWLIVVYCFFTLSINYFVFNLFGASCVIVALTFAVLYLRSENPFSLRTESRGESRGGGLLAAETHCQFGGRKTAAPTFCQETAELAVGFGGRAIGGQETAAPTSAPTSASLFATIEGYLTDSRDFLLTDYTITSLAATVGATVEDTSRAIKCGGYSSFREYILHLRLECFPALAAAMPEASVKELMFACGFNSRSTFYRAFAELYNCTPRDYLLRQHKEDEVKT